MTTTTTTTTATAPLLSAPADDARTLYQTLAYVEAYDAVNDDDYAFVAWRETERDSGAWRIRIQARGLAGAVFEPAQMRGPARAASARGQPFFTWGAGMAPSLGDPRQVEFRVHVDQGQPREIEIHVVMRRFDHSADAPRSVRFGWPQE